jgi:hypothetical protein
VPASLRVNNAPLLKPFDLPHEGVSVVIFILFLTVTFVCDFGSSGPWSL